MSNEEAVKIIDRILDEDNWTSDAYTALEMAIDSLSFNWIKTSDRLPPPKQSVIISTKDWTGEGEYWGHNGYHHIWYQYRWNATYWDDEVIAWMHLPKSYSESEVSIE